MKPRYFIIFSFLFSLLAIFTPIDTVFANQSVYENIDIHVTVHEDGSADFVERWYGHFYHGTEHHIINEDLRGSRIVNFTVTENGETFTQADYWDIDASQEEKAKMSGMRQIDNGVELNWGIGEYGTHEYIVEYTVEDFIIQLDNAQVIFWVFSNPGISIPRENIRIEIESYFDLVDKNTNIWGFGFDGRFNYTNGNLVAGNASRLHEEEYINLLIEFKDGTFTTGKSYDMTMKELKDVAMEGSDYDNHGFWMSLYVRYSDTIINIGMIVLFTVALTLTGHRARQKDGFEVQAPIKFRRRYPEEYYRDYPYQGNFLHAYFIVYRMGAANFNTLLTSLLLKWIYEDKIYMSERRAGIRRRLRQTIHFNTDHHAPESLEGELYQMIKNQAKRDGVITDREIARWAKRDARKLRNWEQDVLRESAESLASQQYTKKNERRVFFMKKTNYTFTAQGNQIAGNVYRFINYLHDYSLLHEHDAINVKLWDEMMIWASYLNLTKVVMDQFKQMYPNYATESKFQERSLYRSAAMARVASENRRQELRRQAEQRKRSSGGGGRVSRGGGSGASGGGRGGGIR